MFEQTVENFLKIHHDFSDESNLNAPRILKKNVPYKSTRNKALEAKNFTVKPSRSEFVLVATHMAANNVFAPVNGYSEIRLECKHQNSSGSAKEKITETYIKMKGSDSKYNIIVVHGDAFTEADIAYYKSLPDLIFVKGSEGNTVKIMTGAEFADFLDEAYPV